MGRRVSTELCSRRDAPAVHVACEAVGNNPLDLKEVVYEDTVSTPEFVNGRAMEREIATYPYTPIILFNHVIIMDAWLRVGKVNMMIKVCANVYLPE